MERDLKYNQQREYPRNNVREILELIKKKGEHSQWLSLYRAYSTTIRQFYPMVYYINWTGDMESSSTAWKMSFSS